eukprot:CAMPEP_0204408748 /NCGR_PEP_ID=MMETSP0470-20130426/9656_1 /ASSEMBLY_ACC=CAM_ASM_000385 /TAXON_ID=2969 /ORGANISM="Oxyrrhis marina" /LENGTH=64 /DNA_ID=CAMNT_0051404543 /DNA_START=71 /DNA_END=262 /DNA_ORIENTATION=+
MAHFPHLKTAAGSRRAPGSPRGFSGACHAEPRAQRIDTPPAGERVRPTHYNLKAARRPAVTPPA